MLDKTPPADVFDDKLARSETETETYDRAVAIAREFGESWGFADVCSMCADPAPLSGEFALHMNAVRQMRKLETATADKLDELGHSAAFLSNELTDAWYDAFHAACADVDECDVCQFEDECGHTRHGEKCPAREEN